ncbi:hypothetical protein GGX14DRAFT_567378 [Mycena pura]|uniref:Uncharacterized protein n=1 Tax=Mycena pura TaxID=153505 RepID=A0AAD6VEG2_9AGAR|nr:hypothetical protein GGX14DRAFT_567378 [Mycena pura]
MNCKQFRIEAAIAAGSRARHRTVTATAVQITAYTGGTPYVPVPYLREVESVRVGSRYLVGTVVNGGHHPVMPTCRYPPPMPDALDAARFPDAVPQRHPRPTPVPDTPTPSPDTPTPSPDAPTPPPMPRRRPPASRH